MSKDIEHTGLLKLSQSVSGRLIGIYASVDIESRPIREILLPICRVPGVGSSAWRVGIPDDTLLPEGGIPEKGPNIASKVY